jgi:hypothetical protein
MTAEVDRLTGVLETMTAERDTLKGQAQGYLDNWQQERSRKNFAKVVSLIACVLASGIVLAVVMGGGK